MAGSPYDEIYKLIEQNKPQVDQEQLERNKRIARVNTLGEGLKSLVDVVGGAAGANVAKRIPSPVAIKAVNDYNQQRFRDAASMDKWNTTNLNAHLKGIAYQDQKDKEAQTQANYESKLGMAAQKIKQDEADKEKERQFKADEWEKNRQSRLKAARISHTPKPKEAKNWQDKPDYTFYDEQTGQSIPMQNGHVDAIIGDIRKEMSNNPGIEKQMIFLDNLIGTNPPAAKEEKRRLVQQYGAKYRDKIIAMSQGSPYEQPVEDTPAPPTLNQFNSQNNSSPAGNPPSDEATIRRIKSDADKIANDNSINKALKKTRIYKLLIKEGYPETTAKSILQGYGL